jgi:uncharacterized protein YehS (DUF1456 family)
MEENNMSSIAKKIVKNKKVNNLSKYLKETYENGFNKGTKATIQAYIEQTRKLKKVEGMTDEMFTKIVKALDLEDLI